MVWRVVHFVKTRQIKTWDCSCWISQSCQQTRTWFLNHQTLHFMVGIPSSRLLPNWERYSSWTITLLWTKLTSLKIAIFWAILWFRTPCWGIWTVRTYRHSMVLEMYWSKKQGISSTFTMRISRTHLLMKTKKRIKKFLLAKDWISSFSIRYSRLSNSTSNTSKEWLKTIKFIYWLKTVPPRRLILKCWKHKLICQKILVITSSIFKST